MVRALGKEAIVAVQGLAPAEGIKVVERVTATEAEAQEVVSAGVAVEVEEAMIEVAGGDVEVGAAVFTTRIQMERPTRKGRRKSLLALVVESLEHSTTDMDSGLRV